MGKSEDSHTDVCWSIAGMGRIPSSSRIFDPAGEVEDEDEQQNMLALPALLALPQAPPQRTQFYVEEASMYTITEDSRENRSVATSIASTKAGTESSVFTPVGAGHDLTNAELSPETGASDWGFDVNGCPVNCSDEDDQDSQPNKNLISVWMSSQLDPPALDLRSDAEETSNPSDRSQEDQYLLLPCHDVFDHRGLPFLMHDERHWKRRHLKFVVIYSLLILIMLISICLAVVVPLAREDSQGSMSIDGVELPTNQNNQITTISPMVSPLTSASDSPTLSSGTSRPSWAPSVQSTYENGDETRTLPRNNPTAPPSNRPASSQDALVSSPFKSSTGSSMPSSAPAYPPQIITNWQKELYEALGTCELTDRSGVTDIRKPQSIAFWKLSWELENVTPNVETKQILTSWGMLMFYLLAGGKQWTNPSDWFIWENFSMSDVCEWTGVTCNDEMEVFAIDLRGRNLVGRLAQEICCIASLKQLDVRSNPHLNGTIPSCFIELESFKYSE